jgi:hypothetical protein
MIIVALVCSPGTAMISKYDVHISYLDVNLPPDAVPYPMPDYAAPAVPEVPMTPSWATYVLPEPGPVDLGGLTHNCSPDARIKRSVEELIASYIHQEGWTPAEDAARDAFSRQFFNLPDLPLKCCGNTSIRGEMR